MTLVVACLVSAAIFAVSIDPAAWLCWWSWAGRRGKSLIVAGLTLGGVFGGLIGWLAQQMGFGFGPGGHPMLQGIFCGLAGSALLKVDFARVTADNPGEISKDSYSLERGTTILKIAVQWIRSALNIQLENNLRKYFRELDEGALFKTASHLRGELSMGLAKSIDPSYLKVLDTCLKSMGKSVAIEQQVSIVVAFCIQFAILNNSRRDEFE